MAGDPLWPDAVIWYGSLSISVQVMGSHLFGAKSLPELMLLYCRLDLKEHIKLQTFQWCKCFWKYQQNGKYLVLQCVHVVSWTLWRMITRKHWEFTILWWYFSPWIFSGVSLLYLLPQMVLSHSSLGIEISMGCSLNRSTDLSDPV